MEVGGRGVNVAVLVAAGSGVEAGEDGLGAQAERKVTPTRRVIRTGSDNQEALAYAWSRSIGINSSIVVASLELMQECLDIRNILGSPS